MLWICRPWSRNKSYPVFFRVFPKRGELTRGGPWRCPLQGNRHHIRRAPRNSSRTSIFPGLSKWYASHHQIVPGRLTCLQNYTVKERPHSRRFRHATGMGTWTWIKQFNPDKCGVIRITNKRHSLAQEYYIHGTKLQTVNDAKYLGVAISSDLSWSKRGQEGNY